MKNIENTYCNPLSIPDCPRGTDGWDAMTYTGEPTIDYRSISDPSVSYFDNKWYMYPSYGMAFVSSDFKTWEHIRTEPYNMKYSPTVVYFRGYYLMTSHSNGLYRSDSPLGPFEYLGDFNTPNGAGYRPTDPALFVDDDGRLYLYCFTYRNGEKKMSYITGTLGVELDGDNPRKMLTDLKLLFEFNTANEWEHFGEYRQDTLGGWVEGQWMLKRGGRYYLVYSSAGTQYSTYCMAAYYSDDGPLSGFVLQKRNPITESKCGLIRGAGHGCITEGPNCTLWAFYTVTLAYTHIFERRVGMDLIAVDENGELYAPHGVTDTPQYAPGYALNPVESNTVGLFPLTFRQRGCMRCTSNASGHEGFYALDDSMTTFWQPDAADCKPSLTVDLQAPYDVSASRLIWREVGLDYDHGVPSGPFRYIIEGKPDNASDEWVTLLDMSANNRDLNVDYRTFETRLCESVRLTICGTPAGITPAVISFSVFGRRNEV